MKLHVLFCGTMQVSEAVPNGPHIDLFRSPGALLAPGGKRVTLPVCAYLIEHPRGLVLVDTGWCRDISPAGVYDARAAAKVLPAPLAAFYRPCLPAGMAVHEQLGRMGISPRDLACVVLTHLDPDHVAGLRHVKDAGRILVSEDEYYWNARTVYRYRQPWSLWMEYPVQRFYDKGSPLGTNRWAYDLFGDESVMLINLPGHTDGLAAVLVRDGKRFALLTSDAAFSPRSWQEQIVPGFGYDPGLQRRALQWIREMAETEGCAAVLSSHDPAAAPCVIEI